MASEPCEMEWSKIYHLMHRGECVWRKGTTVLEWIRLKILSMLMIVCLHILGIGGVDSSCEGNQTAYAMTWMLEIICLCSVNCYGLVTGFLSYDTKPAKLKIRKLIYLWVEVFFYGMLMTMISGLVSSNVSITYVEILGAALPICFSQYWYFTAFVGVYLLSPWLNKLLSEY